MANTERLEVIRQVRAALTAVTGARFDPTLSPEDRQRLESAYRQLDDLEDALIMGELTDRLETLKADSAELRTLAEQIRKQAASLQAIADLIDKAAKAVGVLVDIATRASSAGLI
jgi:hypothetical protein